mgnify:CR=1 FL=1|jgi:hypothetical protein|tara:strand:- start:1808 stop:1993 length:186 start_codon:yes stop_codon:yes gene_type:complete
MNPVPRAQNISDKAIQEFIENGGVIQQIPAGQRSEVEFKNSFYGKRQPKQKEQTEETDDGE